MIHGWDMRTAFDETAALSERPLPVLVGLAQRWLSNTFHPVPPLVAPVRYRFDVSGPTPLRQDVLVSQDSCHLVPVADINADVTFRCTHGGLHPARLWTLAPRSGCRHRAASD